MKNGGKRLLSLLLAAVMLLSLCPVAALAEEEGENTEAEAVTEELTAAEELIEELPPEEAILDEEEEPAEEAISDEEKAIPDEEEIVPEEAEEIVTVGENAPMLLAAASVIASGTCGTNLTWTLDDAGTLTISGTGAMTNWSSESSVPWFSYTSEIKTVRIENGVTSIGDYAFRYCSSLTSIGVTEGNPYYSSEDGVLFNKAKTILIQCPGGKSGSITIPNSVTSIGDDAFSYCNSLTSVTIPNSVTSISTWAFSYCNSLTSILVDAGNINYSAIDGVLFNKDQTKLIACPGGKNGSYSIPNSVTSIGDYAFHSCSSLTSITIPNSVTSIDYGAFASCDSLTSITIPNSVTHIGPHAFDSCSSLTSITIPNSVVSIGYDAFCFCSSLTSITIPNSVTSIGDWAFHSCSSLTSILVDTGNINYSAIDGVLFNKDQTKLIAYPGGKNGSYSIPNSVTSIGNWAFHSCSSLTSITIPNSVTSIGYDAFDSCDSLTSITIPNSVTSIDYGAFDNTALTDIYYTGTEAQWNAISIGSYNKPLTTAVIHYNWNGGQVEPETPLFIEGTMRFDCEDHAGGGITSKTVYYSDSFFSRSSTSFDIDLALASFAAATASFTYGKSSPGNPLNDGDQHIVAFLKQLGFDEETQITTVGYDENHSMEDQCAYLFANRPLSDGSLLVPVLVRSSGYEAEWASNFRVYQSGYTRYAAGFKKAADKVYTAMDSYLNSLGVDRSKVKIWIAGFSRGAAISNLLAARVNQESGIPAGQIYAYTFATPLTTLDPAAYNNIFNIVSEQDAVSRVPLREWSFGRHGTMMYLPSISGNSKVYNRAVGAFKNEFQSLTGTNKTILIGQEIALDLLCDYLEDIVPSTEEYYNYGIQDALITIWDSAQSDKVGAILTTLMNANGLQGIDQQFKNWLSMVSDLMENFSLSKLGETIDLTKNICERLDKAPATNQLVKTLVEIIEKYLTRLQLETITFWSDNGYNDNYDNCIFLIADSIQNRKQGTLFQQHWPMTYMAWLNVYKSLGTANFFSRYGHKIVSVKCPVDVEVYSSSGELVCRIVNDRVDESLENPIYAYVDAFGEKYIYIPDDEGYTTKVTPREECKVSISSTYYDADGNKGETISYVDIPVTETSQMTVTENDQVKLDSQTLEPDAEYSGTQTVTVTLTTEGQGLAVGGGSYDVGESVHLSAIPEEGWSFKGWYKGDSLYSEEETLSFVALDDLTLKAVFEKSGSTPAEDYIVRMYQVCLGRDPGADEIAYYLWEINDHGMTGTEIAYKFIFADEFLMKNYCDRHYAEALYKAFMGRAPSEAEIDSKAYLLQQGQTREQVFNEFVTSSEYKAICDAAGIVPGSAISYSGRGTRAGGRCTVYGCHSADGMDAFNARLYSVVLDRQPAQNELDAWAYYLIHGDQTAKSAAKSFLFSEEFQAHGYDDAQFVSYLYEAMMGRTPGSDEVDYWVWMLSSQGLTREAAFEQFAASDEFMVICAGYGIVCE